MRKLRKSASQHNKDHDSFVRGFLSHVELVEKLLRYALDKKILSFINFRH